MPLVTISGTFSYQVINSVKGGGKLRITQLSKIFKDMEKQKLKEFWIKQNKAKLRESWQQLTEKETTMGSFQDYCEMMYGLFHMENPKLSHQIKMLTWGIDFPMDNETTYQMVQLIELIAESYHANPNDFKADNNMLLFSISLAANKLYEKLQNIADQ